MKEEKWIVVAYIGVYFGEPLFPIDAVLIIDDDLLLLLSQTLEKLEMIVKLVDEVLLLKYMSISLFLVRLVFVEILVSESLLRNANQV